MQIVFHCGVHGTDLYRMVKTLLQNRDWLLRNGIEPVTPNRHREVFGEALGSLRGSPATPEMEQVMLDAVLDSTDVGEVWGVGRKITAQLKVAGIETVLDLARLDPATVRRRWSVVLERTVRELQGMSCIGLDDQPPPKKEIACTRSFGQPIRDLQALEQAVSTFASMAAQKLRRQASHTAHVLVFIHTSPYRKGPQYARSITVPLLRATSDTVPVVNASLAGLRRIYRSGYAFIKAGVMLLDLHSAKLRQGELDLEPQEAEDSTRERLMGVLDELNQRYGRGAVKLACAGVEATGERTSWAMRQERRSPAYTTCWEDMLVVGE